MNHQLKLTEVKLLVKNTKHGLVTGHLLLLVCESEARC